MAFRLLLPAIVIALAAPVQAAPATYDEILDACGAAVQICMTSCDLANPPGFILRRALCESGCEEQYNRCVGTDHLPPAAMHGGQSTGAGTVFDQSGGSLSSPTSGGAITGGGGLRADPN